MRSVRKVSRRRHWITVPGPGTGPAKPVYLDHFREENVDQEEENEEQEWERLGGAEHLPLLSVNPTWVCFQSKWSKPSFKVTSVDRHEIMFKLRCGFKLRASPSRGLLRPGESIIVVLSMDPRHPVRTTKSLTGEGVSEVKLNVLATSLEPRSLGPQMSPSLQNEHWQWVPPRRIVVHTVHCLLPDPRTAEGNEETCQRGMPARHLGIWKMLNNKVRVVRSTDLCPNLVRKKWLQLTGQYRQTTPVVRVAFLMFLLLLVVATVSVVWSRKSSSQALTWSSHPWWPLAYVQSNYDDLEENFEEVGEWDLCRGYRRTDGSVGFPWLC